MRRATAAGILLATLLLMASLPAEAGQPLLPKTRDAVRTLARDSADDADHAAAKTIRQAHKLLREAKGILGESLAPVANDQLQIRASMAQPVVRGAGDFHALVWAGAQSSHWLGVYYVETQQGFTTPALLDVDAEGGVLFFDQGAATLVDRIDITYHFLGIDGSAQAVHVGESELLASLPDVGRADFGAATISHVGHDPEAIFMTPWNLLGENATIGMSLYAGTALLDETTMVACNDFTAEQTQPGCRILYVSLLTPDFTDLVLWHAEGNHRVVDRILARGELAAGYQFAS